MSKTLRWLSVGVITVLAVGFLFPLYWMVVGSLKGPASALKVPPEIFPGNLTLGNYRHLFSDFPTWRWLSNSIVVAGGTTVLTMLFSSLSGYAFGKKDFLGKGFIFAVLLSTMMIPSSVILVPLFLRFRDLGLFNTYLGMILPGVAWPFGIFLVKQFMAQIPDELIEAARADGATEWQIYWHVILSLSKPALGALGIFTFMGTWSDYLWQLVIVNNPTMMTLPVAISTVTRAEFRVDLGLLMTGATVAFLPMLVVFLIFQQHFIRGITVGALKG